MRYLVMAVVVGLLAAGVIALSGCTLNLAERRQVARYRASESTREMAVRAIEEGRQHYEATRSGRRLASPDPQDRAP